MLYGRGGDKDNYEDSLDLDDDEEDDGLGDASDDDSDYDEDDETEELELNGDFGRGIDSQEGVWEEEEY